MAEILLTERASLLLAGDVAIADGRIAAVGKDLGSAKEDGQGRLVSW